MDISFSSSIYDLLQRNIAFGIRSILGYGHIEQNRFLSDESETGTNPMNI